jgi:hypothetical protein
MVDEVSDSGVDNDAGDEVISLTEYKKLQRKTSRQATRNRELGQRVAEAEATSKRIETLMETVLAHSVHPEDAEGTAVVAEAQRGLAAQRTLDTTAVQLETRLNEMLDEADIDWDDERLTEARRLLAVVNDTGNLSMGPAVERAVTEALSPTPSSDDIRTMIDEAVRRDRQESGRVDVQQGTSSGGKYTRNDVKALDIKQLGVRGFREKLNEAYDQMGI